MVKYTTLSLDPKTADTFRRVAQLKRWSIVTFMDFLAELFSNAFDAVNDPDVDITELRELYEHFTIGIFPYGE